MTSELQPVKTGNETRISVVGMGEAYATCGEYAGRHICPSCGNSQLRLRHCKRWDCPVCWPAAVGQAVRRIRPRLEAIDPAKGCFKQWAIYPPRNGALADIMAAAETSVSSIYSLYMPTIRSFMGVYGVVVMHPYTISDVGFAAIKAWYGSHPRSDVPPNEPPADDEHIVPSYQLVPHTQVPDPDPVRPRGSWKILHEIGIEPEYLKPNLHFHVIARGYVPKSTTDEMVRQGWFVRRLNDVGDVDAACGRIRYLLSHAAYDGSKVYRYITPFTYKYRKTSEGRQWDVLRCSQCGDEMRYAAVDTPDAMRVCELPLSAVPVDTTTYDIVRSVTAPSRLLAELRRLASKNR